MDRDFRRGEGNQTGMGSSSVTVTVGVILFSIKKLILTFYFRGKKKRKKGLNGEQVEAKAGQISSDLRLVLGLI